MNLNLDAVDHVTLDLMVNQPQYERYLRAKEADLTGKYEKAKRFYKKRITEMTRDLLKGDTVNDIFVLQAFEAYAKACITHFRNKDKNDTLQEEYVAECVAVGYLPPIDEDVNVEDGYNDDANNADNDNNDDGDNADNATNLKDSSKKKLDILLSFDKHKSAHVSTLDTYVIKTTPPPIIKNNVPIPQQRTINLDDPKFKTKDLKPKPTKPSKPTNNPNHESKLS